MRRLFPIVLVAFLLVSCGSGTTHLPDASGAQGEVLVVMDKGHWESGPGALVRSILEQPVTTLPQREPRFTVVQCSPQSFGSLLRTHHTVLLAAIGSPNDTATTRPLLDRFARGQLVMQVAGEDGANWERSFANEADGLVRTFDRHQRDRIVRRLKKERDAPVSEAVAAAHGISIDVPGGFRIMKQEHGRTWLQRDRMVSGSGLEHNVIEGLLIHDHPYTSDAIFNVPYLVDQRDTVTKAMVDGPTPGSFMVVQRRFETMDLMPQGQATRIDGRYGYLMHGLFGMEGAKMGGPFVSLSTVCESEARLITAEGFVYAPQFNKREYLRELEAILFSLRLPATCSPSASAE